MTVTSKRKVEDALQSSTEVIKFNVGGQRYEVSRSLLEKHRDSMLATIASEQWQGDPEAEIFIERDGARFRYVLDYMRDGSVTLPTMELKEALMKEFEYYGIDVDEDTINDSAMYRAKSFHSVRVAVEDLKQTAHDAQLALHCLTAFLSAGVNFGEGKKSRDVASFLNRANGGQNMKALRTLFNGDDEKARKGANVHLNAVGLNLSAYETYTWDCSTAELEEIDVVQTEE